MKRASDAQLQHWLNLFSGRFDDEYAASVRRVGLIHSRIGLEPRWYMGGYAFILDYLSTMASKTFTSRLNPAAAQAKSAALICALNQAVMLDMDLAISIYIEENKAAYDRKLDALAHTFEGKIGPVVDGITMRSNALKDTAISMSAAAEQTDRQAVTVAAAAEEASANVQTVAAATENLTISIGEISRQVDHSTKISNAAVEAAQRSNLTVQGLSAAAKNIGDVVKLISDVASQTNLLALNATIEAARAGDAGKGFAVVASEVKSLANQTARATENIASQVAAIQAATLDTVQAIEGFSSTIDAISGVATAIAAAVEEQSASTKAIARNIQDAALGTDQVSGNIGGMKKAAGDTGTAAVLVLTAAAELGIEAKTLSEDVSEFLSNIRAA